ncbi:hypothetical protein DM01DRAFT_69118 [Hesseltinella vesiculosa]|uniref:Uncharacterized protein n=1 Tax=Hesseltinella vesiculosa TaxID=101127 RepID=A0A1X2GKG3_9FUNG|nr:hypothetical protein DM01DRAFT_69118 [Hesseltinella vesiculosa]
MMANPQAGAIGGQNPDAQKSVSLMQRLASKLDCTPLRNDRHGHRTTDYEANIMRKDKYLEKKQSSKLQSKLVRKERSDKPYMQKTKSYPHVKGKTTVIGKRKPGWTDQQWELYQKGHCVHYEKTWAYGHQCTAFLEKQANDYMARAARLSSRSSEDKSMGGRNEDAVMGDIVSPSALFEDLQLCKTMRKL